MMQRAFKQIDVFTGMYYFDNPLAVALHGSHKSDGWPA